MSLRDAIGQLTVAEAAHVRSLIDPWRWATETAQIRLPKGGPISLVDRPFLRDIYRDNASEIVTMKGAQLGLSTSAIVRALWMLTTFPSVVVYSFPSRTDVTKYTQGRINPVVRRSPFLLGKIVDVNSVMQKQFLVGADDRSTIYFSGASTETDAISVDADLLIHDEEDLSNPEIIEQFESRLDASRFRWKFRLSTPRIPGAGIDRAYQDTDRRRWLITCSRCNHEFEMAFPGGPQPYSTIEPDPNGWTPAQVDAWERDGSPAQYVCPSCGRPLRAEDRLAGRWDAERPSPGRAHGYAVSQMAAPWIPASRIIARFVGATWRASFWNLTMGIPWEDEANAMTEAAIRERCDETRPMALTGSGCTMGVDVGAKMDVVIGHRDPDGVPRTIWFDRVDGFDSLDRLMTRYGVSICVIDSSPEDHATRAWAKKYNPANPSHVRQVKVWRCDYSSPRSGRGAEVVWNEKLQLVTVPRTETLTRSSHELLEVRRLPRYDPGLPQWAAYIAHHRNSKLVPILVEGIVGAHIVDHYAWHEIGPDHMFHAGTYEMIARDAPMRGLPPTRGMIGLRTQDRSSELERSIEGRQRKGPAWQA